MSAQEQQLAYQFFRNGDYEKAAVLYESLLEKHPYNSNYIAYLIDSYQQLERFNDSETLILKQIQEAPDKAYLYVEYGYNYQLQHDSLNASHYYNKALDILNTTPNATLGYLVGKSFQDNHLLDKALQAYQITMQRFPKANYYFQIAFIYGEKGDIPKMFETYLNMIALNSTYLNTSKTYIGQFVTDDPESDFNNALKRLLIKRMQMKPSANWNHLLSWLYIQEMNYPKAFVQEKALHKRNNNNELSGIINLGEIAFDKNDLQTARLCFEYLLSVSSNVDEILMGRLYLLEINIRLNESETNISKQFKELFSTYGKGLETLEIQLVYAQYLGFKRQQTEMAKDVLEEVLSTLTLTPFQKGRVKTLMGDLLVFENKFNSALIYFTQVQHELKNHEIAQLARFKIAQTSYYKGDFKWAKTQLNILKNASSRLIANDALDLNLLITDNSVKDSLKIILKKYARADLLAYQQKDSAAITALDDLITKHKAHPIYDEALFKQARLFEKIKDYNKAIQNYLAIIASNPTDILADDALFYLAELYANTIGDHQKAIIHYEKILFDYSSSIHLVKARKQYRLLRGDQLN